MLNKEIIDKLLERYEAEIIPGTGKLYIVDNNEYISVTNEYLNSMFDCIEYTDISYHSSSYLSFQGFKDYDIYREGNSTEGLTAA